MQRFCFVFILAIFVVNSSLASDAIVSKNGLMWMKCAVGQKWNGSTCKGKAVSLTWMEARKVAKKNKYAGYSDWRLPTLQDFDTLVYCSTSRRPVKRDERGMYLRDSNEQPLNGECVGTNDYRTGYDTPTIDSKLFPNFPDWFMWTSDQHHAGEEYYWLMNFQSGRQATGTVTIGNNVILVRDTSK